jgi:hypothetical protein
MYGPFMEDSQSYSCGVWLRNRPTRSTRILLELSRETPQHRFLSAEDQRSGSQAGSGKMLHEFLYLVIEIGAARYHLHAKMALTFPLPPQHSTVREFKESGDWASSENWMSETWMVTSNHFLDFSITPRKSRNRTFPHFL